MGAKRGKAKSDGRFKKGDPRAGRPKGTQNKTTIEAREFAKALVEDESYRKRLQARMKDGSLPPAIESMLWHYAYGKPKETHEVTGPNGGPIDFDRMELVLVKSGKPTD